jgi:hypothetical protein
MIRLLVVSKVYVMGYTQMKILLPLGELSLAGAETSKDNEGSESGSCSPDGKKGDISLP